jgi:uncharacterized protein (TIGR03067 family)
MKQFVIYSFVGIAIACTAPKKATKNSGEMNGNWIPVKQEMGGRDLPAAAFENYKLVVQDSIYTYGRADIDQGAVYYKNGKLDIYGRSGVNAGKHYTAIYKIENSQLNICYNLAGDSYPESFETKSKPTLFLSVYKKE